MFRVSRILSALVSVAFSLASSQRLLSQIQSADSFDEPLKKKVVYFGPSPDDPGGNVRVKLSGYFYSTFVVKEYDEGRKGAERLAIVPVEKNATPECTPSHAPDEKVIEKPEWGGYFRGAKGNLVFFYAADGVKIGFVFGKLSSRLQVSELSFAERGLMALKAGVEKVIEEHAYVQGQTFVWRDGKRRRHRRRLRNRP